MKKTLLLGAAFLLLTMAATAQKTKITIDTDSGRIVMMLYDGTPRHRDNMIKLAKQHFYDSLLWHRVIPNFVIQGGDPDSKHAKPGQQLGNGDVGYKVPAEFNPEYFHKRGAVGMARDNNPEKASSGCQFYIVTGKVQTDADLDNAQKRSGHTFTPAQREVYKTIGGVPFLDGGYTVFGEVSEGMDVVDKISNMPRNNADRPKTDVHILKLRVKKKKRFLIF